MLLGLLYRQRRKAPRGKTPLPRLQEAPKRPTHSPAAPGRLWRCPEETTGFRRGRPAAEKTRAEPAEGGRQVLQSLYCPQGPADPGRKRGHRNDKTAGRVPGRPTRRGPSSRLICRKGALPSSTPTSRVAQAEQSPLLGMEKRGGRSPLSERGGCFTWLS